MTPLATVRFNPYWNAPASIVEKDIVPRMLSSRPSTVMHSMNMKVFEGVGGPEIDPDKVDWRRAVVDNYHFRQDRITSYNVCYTKLLRCTAKPDTMS